MRLVKETARFLAAGLWPFGHDARRVYRALGTTNLPGEESFFVNLGYWERPEHRQLDQGARALADLLGQEARLGPEDELLDVGFGFGDQDLHWSQAFGPRRIHGLNVTEFQVEIARQRVREAGLEERIDLQVGDATRIAFGEERFDKVLALESAFHFRTRRRFFDEAFRVLRPGGRLATADIILMPGRRVGWPFTSAWQIPKENLCDREQYAEHLREAGFVGVEVRSIREHVYPPFLERLGERLEHPEVRSRMNPMLRYACRPSWLTRTVLGRFDYVIAVADKPRPAVIKQFPSKRKAAAAPELSYAIGKSSAV
jgi:cyclopropane fatty-acyl-phospholipid synthase-like methyltransferase